MKRKKKYIQYEYFIFAKNNKYFAFSLATEMCLYIHKDLGHGSVQGFLIHLNIPASISKMEHQACHYCHNGKQ